MANAWDPQKRVALVTGASRGLGFAIAQALAQKGYALLLNARDRQRLKEAANAFETPVLFFAADSASPQFATQLHRLCQKFRIQKLDLVVHNAGINHIGTIAQTKLRNAELTLRTNALSCIVVAQATAPLLEHSSEPRFVLVSSLMQYFAMPGRSVYAASKAAAEIFVRAWASELRAVGSKIRMQILRPAGIATGFHTNTPTDGSAPHSTISRMSAEQVASYLVRLVESNRRVLAPGFTNKLVAFVARHFPDLAAYLAYRRYVRGLQGQS
ncbi:MAG: SDR family NAD(P)-dependent oxidoreductase [Turneriella sp.]|nr:SDR family NAD(P)-dependent oxidoreductase [Leptospiraceae bacterium]MCX7632603.1 SDR family NAD(P)-dependent oxidoreductase [Turneriella sp.]